MRFLGDSEQAGERMINRSRIRESLLYFGFEHDHIARLGEMLKMFASDTAAQLLALQFRDVLVIPCRKCFFHIALPFWHL